MKRAELKTQMMTFGGKQYEYVLCPKCEVWIPQEDFKDGTHESCERHQRSLETRRLATKRVLGTMR